MSLRNTFLTEVSLLAVCFYWNQKKLLSSLTLLPFGIFSNIFIPEKKLEKIETAGYIRPLTQSDIVPGSHAEPGWIGFFASDGDIVFWEPELRSPVWEVNGQRVYFQYMQ